MMPLATRRSSIVLIQKCKIKMDLDSNSVLIISLIFAILVNVLKIRLIVHFGITAAHKEDLISVHLVDYV